MNFRALLNGILAVICLVVLVGVFAQRRQLTGLRAEQQRLRAQVEATPDAPAPTLGAMATDQTQPGSGVSSPRELLRLRNEVTQLGARQRELAGVRGENERLHAQVAARAANAPAAGGLPPGYILRSKAQFLGYSTPEDTMQSVLWALQKRDFTNLLQAMTPETAQKLQAQVQRPGLSVEEFFTDVGSLPGMRVLNRQQMPDGSIGLNMEVVPGEAKGTPFRFRQIDGQWKMETF